MKTAFITIFVSLLISLTANATSDCASELSPFVMPTDAEIEKAIVEELEDSAAVPGLITNVLFSPEKVIDLVTRVEKILVSNLQIERNLGMFIVQQLAKELVDGKLNEKAIYEKIKQTLIDRRKLFWQRMAAKAPDSQAKLPLTTGFSLDQKGFTKDSSTTLDLYRTNEPINIVDLFNLVPRYELMWPRVPRISQEPKPAAVIYELKQMPGVYLALFNTVSAMNDAFQRASIAIEQKEWPLRGTQVLGMVAGGHDLKGTDLLPFAENAKTTRELDLDPPMPLFAEQTAKAEAVRRILFEEEFFTRVILPTIAKRGAENVVFLAASTDASPLRVVSHEMWHGYYFTNARYANAVREYWSKHLTAEEREQFKKMAKGFAYDIADEELMANEFQAFMLEIPTLRGNTPQEILHEQVETALSPKFKEYLKQNNLMPEGL